MVHAIRRIAVSSTAALTFGYPALGGAQETFQAEAGLSYSRSKADGLQQNSASLDATYFFHELPQLPRDYPLDQVPFVERAGGLTAYYTRSSFDIEGFQNVIKPSSYSIAARFTPPDTPLILGAGYGYSYAGKYGGSLGTATYDTESEAKGYQLTVGSYIDKSTAFTLDWSRDRGEAKITSTSPSLNLTESYTSTSIGLSGQHLARLGNGDHIAIWASFTQRTFEPEGAETEKNRSYFFRTTYYPTKMLGLWLGIQVDRGDGTSLEGETYLAGASMFVTQDASLGLAYLRFQAKASDDNANTVMLSGRMRF